MKQRSSIILHAFIGVVLLVVWFGTLVVMSVSQTGVPVGDGLELWRINSSEGWSLVVPKDGVAQEELVSQVIGFAKLDDNVFVVEDKDAEMSMVSRTGELWNVHATQSNANGVESARFRKPGNLKLLFTIKESWWIFALEALMCVIAILTVRFLSRHGAARQSV